MKLEVAFPDAERATIELLEELVDAQGLDATVGVGVPTGWTPDATPHLQVAWDGTPIIQHPILAHATIRIVARAATTTEAKRLVAIAQGLLLAHAGGNGIARIGALTGVQPARDPDTQAELAAVTVRVTVRAEPIPGSGS